MLNEILKDEKLGNIMNAHEEYEAEQNTAKLMVMQYHLYKHTLYEKLDSSNDMNVLVWGFNTYAQKFLDACLQAGQIPNRKLNVSVIAQSTRNQNTSNSGRSFHTSSTLTVSATR